MTARSWKSRAAIALLVLLVSLLPLATLEVAGRAWIWWRHGVPGKSYGIWLADPELGAILRPDAYNTIGSTNDVGMRGGEDLLEPKPAGSLRIVCYGGSTTFGYNLADEDLWTLRLQELLRERQGHGRDQVLNGGRVAWSLGHLVKMARRELPRLRPDIVVIYSGVNEELNATYLRSAGMDLEALAAKEQWGVVTREFPFCNPFQQRLVLGRLAYSLSHPTPEDRPEPSSEPTPEDSEPFRNSWVFRNYLAQLHEMLQLVEANGGTPLFVVEAGVFTRNSRPLSYSALGAEEARRLGVATCDPRPAFVGRASLFTSSGVHPTAEGARVLAAEIERCLLESVVPEGGS